MISLGSSLAIIFLAVVADNASVMPSPEDLPINSLLSTSFPQLIELDNIGFGSALDCDVRFGSSAALHSDNT